MNVTQSSLQKQKKWLKQNKMQSSYSPASCGALLCFPHIKSHHEKTVVAKFNFTANFADTLCQLFIIYLQQFKRRGVKAIANGLTEH